MSAPANQLSAPRPIVVVIEGSERFVGRCRAAMAGHANVVRCDLGATIGVGGLGQVRVVVVTADVYGGASHAISDVARRLRARLVKLPSEEMPDRYLAEAMISALHGSGVRRLF